METAWAGEQSRGQAAGIGGPPIGGALFSVARSVPFLVHAISYAFSVVTALLIPAPVRPAGDGRAVTGRMHRELMETARYVRGKPLLRAFVLQAPLVNFAFGGVTFSIPVVLRLGGVHAAVIGVVMAAFSVGALAGALMSAVLARRLPLAVIVAGVAAVSMAMFAVAAVVAPSPFVAIPMVATGALAPAANTALLSRMSRVVPNESMGRVVNVMVFAGSSLGALAPLAAGALVASVGGHAAIGVFAGAESAALLVALVQWRVWNAPVSEDDNAQPTADDRDR
jgi:predicted MFS family arabinose efflux permease